MRGETNGSKHAHLIKITASARVVQLTFTHDGTAFGHALPRGREPHGGRIQAAPTVDILPDEAIESTLENHHQHRWVLHNERWEPARPFTRSAFHKHNAKGTPTALTVPSKAAILETGCRFSHPDSEPQFLGFLS